MANENEQEPAAVPSADIPDLKKREKERKKAGIGWGGNPGAGGTGFQGAVGGSGQAAAARAAASAAARAGGQAAVQAGRSALMNSVSSFMATAAGKMVAAVLALGVIGGGAAVLMSGGGRTAGAGGAELGGISSNINTKRAGRSGLDYAKGQGAGMLKAEDAGKAGQGAEKTGETGKTEDAGKTEMADTMDRDGIQKTQDGGPTDLMENNMKGAKLSEDLGKNFGGKSVFSANGGRFGNALPRDKIKAFSVPQKSGKGGTMVARNLNASRNMTLRGLKSNRALGQLRGMSSLNSKIKGQGSTADESNAAMASTQFESTQIDGGQAPTGPDGQTSANPDLGGGGGAACNDGFYPNASGQCVEIPNQGGINVSPWQAPWDQAMMLINQAIKMLWIASILYAIFWTLYLFFLPIPDCSDFGIQLVFFVIALGILAMFTKMCIDLANQVMEMGDQINKAKGEPMGDKIKDIGKDLKTGAYLAILYGVGGAVFASKAQSKLNNLQKDADDKKLRDQQ